MNPNCCADAAATFGTTTRGVTTLKCDAQNGTLMLMLAVVMMLKYRYRIIMSNTMYSVFMLTVVMLSVVMLSVVMLSVVMITIVMPSVVSSLCRLAKLVSNLQS
jgi:hypothetical protein